MINIKVEADFVGEGVSWIDSQILYIGDRSKKILKEIGTKIQEDITENVLQSRSINGGQVARNLPSTVKSKGFNRPLFHRGLLSRSIALRSITGGYEVYVKGKANDYASYPHFGTNRSVARPYFGISQSTDNDIDIILGNPL